MQQATVSTCTVFKTGTGKKGPWTLYKVVTTDGQEPSGFDLVQPGEIIEITSVQNGQYTNLNYKKVAGAQVAAAPAAAPYTPPTAQPAAAPQAVAPAANDPRVLRLLVLIATQVGIPNEQIMGIVENAA